MRLEPTTSPPLIWLVSQWYFLFILFWKIKKAFKKLKLYDCVTIAIFHFSNFVSCFILWCIWWVTRIPLQDIIGWCQLEFLMLLWSLFYLLLSYLLKYIASFSFSFFNLVYYHEQMMSYLGHSPLSLSLSIYIFLILCSYILIACFLMCSKLHLWLNFLVLVKLSGGKSPHCLYNRQMLKLLRILLQIAYKLYHDSDCDWCYIAHIWNIIF